MDGYLQIHGAVVKHDMSLHKGVGFTDYLSVLSTLEIDGYLECVESENPDRQVIMYRFGVERYTRLCLLKNIKDTIRKLLNGLKIYSYRMTCWTKPSQ